MTDYYQVLGVRRGATGDEVRAAFRARGARCHPDRGGDGTEFRRLSEAYHVLGHPGRRRAYDARGAPRPSGGAVEWAELFEILFGEVARSVGASGADFGRRK